MPTQKKPRKVESARSQAPGEQNAPMSNDLTQYVTTRQAADSLGVVTDHINHLLAKGKIKGIKLGYSWLVYVPSLEAYQKSKSPGGRPRSRETQTKGTN